MTNLKTVDIKGKAYVEVNERVKYFRQAEEYAGWSLETELLSNEDGMCIFKAIVKDSAGVVKATGHAYENEGSTFINKTSYIENCETSAVGRALGMLGIGIDTSIASSEEVQNAMANQGEAKPNNGINFDKIREEVKDLDTPELVKKFSAVKGYSKYTDKQKEAICKIIQAEMDSRKEA